MQVQSPVGNVSTHPSRGVINLNCLWGVGKSAITAPKCEMFLLLMQLSDKQFSFQMITMVMSVSIRIQFLSFLLLEVSPSGPLGLTKAGLFITFFFCCISSAHFFHLLFRFFVFIICSFIESQIRRSTYVYFSL